MNAVRQSGPFDCGPAALAHCLRRLGIDAPYPDARGRIRPSVRGCRLDELADEALRWGWEAHARRAPSWAVRRLRAPSILHVDGDHFVVLEAREGAGEGQTWRLHDPARGAQRWSTTELQRRWSGWWLEFMGGEPGPEW